MIFSHSLADSTNKNLKQERRIAQSKNLKSEPSYSLIAPLLPLPNLLGTQVTTTTTLWYTK